MARTVGLPMKVFRLILMPICSASLATSTAASREWPPRSKKLSSTPTWSDAENLREQLAQGPLPGGGRGPAAGAAA